MGKSLNAGGILLAVILAIAVILPLRAAQAQGTTVDVDIPGFSFSPADITVEIGTTVRWTNNHSVLHTSTSDDGVWDSGDLTPGADFSFTFLATGVYPYHCTYHSVTMTGAVTVENTGASTDINIPGILFNPSNLSVETGTVVRWTNNDNINHTTTANGGVWDSGVMSPGADFSYLFLNTGDYPYFCVFHPSMLGVVTVTEPLSCLCGDANDDDDVNILDIVFLINFKYKNGPDPDFLVCSDVNDDGDINILDIVYLINFKYKSGPDPVCA